jgi:hypothetical protein
VIAVHDEEAFLDVGVVLADEGTDAVRQILVAKF